MVQGTGFNWHDQNHFRMVFLPNEDDLKIAISRFADYLTEFKKKVKK
jgi:alanine-synthesizing transaminase